MTETGMKHIAHIESDYSDKFGIPRQSGLVESEARIVFEPEFRDPNALRGIEDWSHLWLIWEFSKAISERWSPTVRPPRLGGNTRLGVFATRSPFRPNPIGLSSVKLTRVVDEAGLGRVLYVVGADLMNGTPIYDIKPYLPYTDSHPEASGGFANGVFGHRLEVSVSQGLLEELPTEKREALCELLAQDPCPSYKSDPHRIYGVRFAGYEVKFRVESEQLEVLSIERE